MGYMAFGTGLFWFKNSIWNDFVVDREVFQNKIFTVLPFLRHSPLWLRTNSFNILHFSSTVPPNEPVIRNKNGQELISREIGPYEVGHNLILDCEVSGGNYWINDVDWSKMIDCSGRPTKLLTWWPDQWLVICPEPFF